MVLLLVGLLVVLLGLVALAVVRLLILIELLLLIRHLGLILLRRVTLRWHLVLEIRWSTLRIPRVIHHRLVHVLSLTTSTSDKHREEPKSAHTKEHIPQNLVPVNFRVLIVSERIRLAFLFCLSYLALSFFLEFFRLTFNPFRLLLIVFSFFFKVLLPFFLFVFSPLLVPLSIFIAPPVFLCLLLMRTP